MEAVKDTLPYGKSGIRLLNEKDGLINYKHAKYIEISIQDEEYYGFRVPYGYLARIDGKDIELSFKNVKTVDDIAQAISPKFDKDELMNKGVLIDKDKGLIFMLPQYFINLRQDTSKPDGTSPYENDLQRINLLINTYKELNREIEYGGTGRLLIQTKEGYGKNKDSQSTPEFIDNKNFNELRKSIAFAKQEATEMAKKLKYSNPEDIILVSEIFDKITKLERVTKATEYFEWLSNDGEYVSQLFNIQAVLIGLGQYSGNISMETSIDNGVLMSIVPTRETFAIQLNKIANMLGLEKMYFNKYELAQIADNSAIKLRLANTIKLLLEYDLEEPAKQLQEQLLLLK